MQDRGHTLVACGSDLDICLTHFLGVCTEFAQYCFITILMMMMTKSIFQMEVLQMNVESFTQMRTSGHTRPTSVLSN